MRHCLTGDVDESGDDLPLASAVKKMAAEGDWLQRQPLLRLLLQPLLLRTSADHLAVHTCNDAIQHVVARVLLHLYK